MKHKHADLIIAWANGAVIQSRHQYRGEWQEWTSWPLDVTPDWSEEQYDYEFRIKPEEKKPVVRWLWANTVGDVFYKLSDYEPCGYPIKLEWSRTEFPE